MNDLKICEGGIIENHAYTIHEYLTYITDQKTAFKWIEKRQNLNVLNNYGETPLMYLCKYYQFNLRIKSIIFKLIENGCDLNVQDTKDHKTALFDICVKISNDAIDIIDKLLDYGANVDLLTTDNWSPINVACIHAREDVAIKLLNKSNFNYLESGKPYNSSVINLIHKCGLTQVLEHVKLLYRNSILESIDDQETIISKCRFDLNLIDILVDFIY